MNWIFLQILGGSFSAVSTSIFTSKYSLESSWRDLQDLHTFAPLRSQNFSQTSSTFFSRLNNWISDFLNFFLEFCIFLRIFDEFFSGFRAKFQKIVMCVAFSIKFAKTNQKFAENSEFCENYSLLFKIIHWCPYSLAGGTTGSGSAKGHVVMACSSGEMRILRSGNNANATSC